MTEPSTDWEEKIADFEADLHQELAERLGKLQQKTDGKVGSGRALHRKQIAACRAELTVHEDGPAEARFGLFAKGAVYPAAVRMSNGAFGVQNDRVPDVRGFAFSVSGVAGAAALGGTTERQDFLFINRTNFGLADSRDFKRLLVGSLQGPLGIGREFTKAHGLVEGGRMTASFAKDLAKPFNGFAVTNFYTTAPITCGPYAVKVRLKPRQSAGVKLPPGDLHADVAERLREGDLQYDIALQFYLNDELTPIEDASAEWDASSPFHTVATLRLPQQSIESDDGQALAERVEQGQLDPWAGLAAHRPLGEIMRARKVAYYASQQQRSANAGPLV